jgi:hypothetical protein
MYWLLGLALVISLGCANRNPEPKGPSFNEYAMFHMNMNIETPCEMVPAKDIVITCDHVKLAGLPVLHFLQSFPPQTSLTALNHAVWLIKLETNLPFGSSSEGTFFRINDRTILLTLHEEALILFSVLTSQYYEGLSVELLSKNFVEFDEIKPDLKLSGFILRKTNDGQYIRSTKTGDFSVTARIGESSCGTFGPGNPEFSSFRIVLKDDSKYHFDLQISRNRSTDL